MVAYNFQREFASKVESLEKRQTVRPRGRRRHARPGDALQLYTGQRTRSCRKLLEAVCKAAADVIIDRDGNALPLIHIAGQKLDALEAYAFARADGFTSAEAMTQWFEQQHGLPVDGVCIQW